jgi:hypothetical protein
MLVTDHVPAGAPIGAAARDRARYELAAGMVLSAATLALLRKRS